jgi:hypothetical protein
MISMPQRQLKRGAAGRRECAVCRAPIPFGLGCVASAGEAEIWFGCVACLAIWLEGRTLDGFCQDCIDCYGPDSPASEWACF